MLELIKTNHDTFKEFFTGTKGNKTVNCILDINCIRYTVIVNGKRTIKREYPNTESALCFQRATAELNK